MSRQPQPPTPAYEAARTALLFIDPYNDFLSPGGKLWSQVEAVAEAVGLLDNLRSVTSAARAAGLQVFIVPHHRAQPDDLSGWRHPTPYQRGAAQAQVFAQGDWGGEWRTEFAPRPGDVVVKEHWAASGFANTDLDMLLKQHGISHVILIGLLANTCVEGTARMAVELGYHVTLVSDATAAFSPEAMHAAHVLNAPAFAHAILRSAELVGALPRPAGAATALAPA
ncbi:MAG: isochorismatase family cysteine hydrolase [Phenylobacterium sp.]|nr:isochorismatase family cysteine hydrolase [Phenylobacterium sp.]